MRATLCCAIPCILALAFLIDLEWHDVGGVFEHSVAQNRSSENCVLFTPSERVEMQIEASSRLPGSVDGCITAISKRVCQKLGFERTCVRWITEPAATGGLEWRKMRK